MENPTAPAAEVPQIPVYEMPTDAFTKKIVTDLIRDEVRRQILDGATGRILDVRTCAALIVGNIVEMVADPDRMRKALAKDHIRFALLEKHPGIRVYYAGSRTRSRATR